MSRLGMHRFFCCLCVAVTVAAPAWMGCSDKNGSTTTPEAGTGAPDTGTPDPNDASVDDSDTSACGKLPPTGLGQIIDPRTDGNDLGQGAVLTLDKKGRPLFAYLDHPPSQTSTLYVVRWNDCTATWYPPAKVDDAILGDVSSGSRLVAISTDPSDGRIGIAYEKKVHLVSPPRQNDTRATFVAVSSDDGATFTATRVSKHKAETEDTEGDINDTDDPAIVLGGGKTYLAYNQTQQGCGTTCQDATVLATGTGGTFAYEVVKDSSDTDHGGTLHARGFPLGLALDSDGVPGVVTHREPPAAYNTVVAYWRPGDATFKTVLDSNNAQNDDGAASLAYDGKKPRVVTRVQRGPIGAVADYTLVFSASDDGTTWSSPLPLPQAGHIAPSEKILAGGGKVTVLAGGPNVLRSTDLTTFTQDQLGVAEGSVSVSGAIGADGKLWVGFEGTSPYVSTAVGGVVLYREP